MRSLPVISSQPPTSIINPARLGSLDALRGFDMLWILGADELRRAAEHLGKGPFLKTMASQLSHSHWEGFRFYDLIFPLRAGMAELVSALVGIGLCVVLCRFLYQRKIFLRL